MGIALEINILLILLCMLSITLSLMSVCFIAALSQRNVDLTKQLRLMDEAMSEHLAIAIFNDAQQCKRPWRV